MKTATYHAPTGIPDHEHGDPDEWAAFIAEASILDRPDWLNEDVDADEAAELNTDR